MMMSLMTLTTTGTTMKKKNKRFNRMRCMVYKGRSAFLHRTCNRKKFLNLITNRASGPSYISPLVDYFDIDPNDIDNIKNISGRAATCMSAPYFKSCRNTLLCEECLSKWRYKLVKTLQSTCDPDRIYHLISRKHDFIIPRGLVKGVSQGSRGLTHLFSDAFNSSEAKKFLLTHLLEPFQQEPGQIFSVVDGVNCNGFTEQNYNDFYCLYKSAILPRDTASTPGTPWLADLMEGAVMCSSIPQHMAIEQSYMNNLDDSFGCAHRSVFRLVDDNNLLCLSLQTLMLSCRIFEEFRYKVIQRLTHGSKRRVTQYNTPVYNESDIYVSHRITIDHMVYSVDDPIPEVLKFVESTFPYNVTLDNMTMYEYLACYRALLASRKQLSSCTGYFRK